MSLVVAKSRRDFVRGLVDPFVVSAFSSFLKISSRFAAEGQDRNLTEAGRISKVQIVEK